MEGFEVYRSLYSAFRGTFIATADPLALRVVHECLDPLYAVTEVEEGERVATTAMERLFEISAEHYGSLEEAGRQQALEWLPNCDIPECAPMLGIMEDVYAKIRSLSEETWGDSFAKIAAGWNSVAEGTRLFRMD
jgi:hypothetical protein